MKRLALQPHQAALDRLFAYMNAYCGIEKEQFRLLTGFLIIRKAGKKELLLEPGQTEEYINYIVKGVVRKYIKSEKKEVTLQLSTEGHFIHAEISFHTGLPAEYYLEAIEPAILLAIHRKDVEILYNQLPILNKLARLMISEMYMRKEMRDLALLRLSAKDRFLRYMQKHPDMLQRVSQKYIASYLQIKPETFSPLKHLLQHKK